MDEDELLGPLEWTRKCLCGKIFYQLNSYSNHINSCKPYKRNLGAQLEVAKARYQSRKSKKGKEKQSLSSRYDDDLDVDLPQPFGSPSSLEQRGVSTSLDMGSDAVPGPSQVSPA